MSNVIFYDLLVDQLMGWRFIGQWVGFNPIRYADKRIVGHIEEKSTRDDVRRHLNDVVDKLSNGQRFPLAKFVRKVDIHPTRKGQKKVKSTRRYTILCVKDLQTDIPYVFAVDRGEKGLRGAAEYFFRGKRVSVYGDIVGLGFDRKADVEYFVKHEVGHALHLGGRFSQGFFGERNNRILQRFYGSLKEQVQVELLGGRRLKDIVKEMGLREYSFGDTCIDPGEGDVILAKSYTPTKFTGLGKIISRYYVDEVTYLRAIFDGDAVKSDPFFVFRKSNIEAVADAFAFALGSYESREIFGFTRVIHPVSAKWYGLLGGIFEQSIGIDISSEISLN